VRGREHRASAQAVRRLGADHIARSLGQRRQVDPRRFYPGHLHIWDVDHRDLDLGYVDLRLLDDGHVDARKVDLRYRRGGWAWTCAAAVRLGRRWRRPGVGSPLRVVRLPIATATRTATRPFDKARAPLRAGPSSAFRASSLSAPPSGRASLRLGRLVHFVACAPRVAGVTRLVAGAALHDSSR
jgi:hypothetical protein